MGRRRKGDEQQANECVKSNEVPKAYNTRRKNTTVVDDSSHRPVKLKTPAKDKPYGTKSVNAALKRKRHDSAKHPPVFAEEPSYQYAVSDIISSQSDGPGEVGWEWKPVGGDPSSHNTDISELVKAFSVGERPDDAVQCTPPVLRGWLESPSGDQQTSASTANKGSVAVKARPRVKRGRRGGTSGGGSECKELLQKLAALYEQQEKETESSDLEDDAISPKRTRLNNEGSDSADNRNSSLDNSAELFDPTQKPQPTSATSTQAFPASLPDIACLSPIGPPQQKSHVDTESPSIVTLKESPKNHMLGSPVLQQKTLLSTPVNTHKRSLSVRRTPGSAHARKTVASSVNQKSFEELWTDDEMFDNDSFLAMTQAIATKCGGVNSPSNACKVVKEAEKKSVIENIVSVGQRDGEGLVSAGLASKTKDSKSTGSTSVFKLPVAPIKVTPNKNKMPPMRNKTVNSDVVDKQDVSNRSTVSSSKFNFSKSDKAVASVDCDSNFVNRQVNNYDSSKSSHLSVKTNKLGNSNSSRTFVQRPQNTSAIKSVANKASIQPMSNSSATNSSTKTNSTVSAKTVVRQSRSLRSPRKPKQLNYDNTVDSTNRELHSSKTGSSKTCSSEKVKENSVCDISISEELLSALAEPDDLLDSEENESPSAKTDKTKNESSKNHSVVTESATSKVHIVASKSAAKNEADRREEIAKDGKLPETTQELLDFSVGGGEDDSLAGGDLLATQQLFAMLDAVETNQQIALESKSTEQKTGSRAFIEKSATVPLKTVHTNVEKHSVAKIPSDQNSSTVTDKYSKQSSSMQPQNKLTAASKSEPTMQSSNNTRTSTANGSNKQSSFTASAYRFNSNSTSTKPKLDVSNKNTPNAHTSFNSSIQNSKTISSNSTKTSLPMHHKPTNQFTNATNLHKPVGRDMPKPAMKTATSRVFQKYPSFDSLDMQASPKAVVNQTVSCSQDSPGRKAAAAKCTQDQIERKRLEALQKRKNRLKLNKRT